MILPLGRNGKSGFAFIDPGRCLRGDKAVERSALKAGFTLIELLVVIAIVAVLAVVVVLVLNPAQLLQQARDSNRLSDLATLNSSLGYYITDSALSGTQSLGSASTTYASLPDPAATSTAGDQCQGLGLPSSTFAWHCAASSTYRKADGTGWIPVNFAGMTTGSPLGQLPADPANASSSNLFYTYTTNGSQYEVTAVLESAKYKLQLAQSPQIQGYPEVAAQGTNLTLSGLWNPSGLVGWWPLTEGSGTVALDFSGNGNNGTWAGTAPYYASGKVGPYAGTFDGSTDRVTFADTAALRPVALTLVAWENLSNTTCAAGNANCIIFSKYGGDYHGVILENLTGGTPYFQILSSSTSLPAIAAGTVSAGKWSQIAGTWDGATMALYVNGVSVATTSASAITWDVGGGGMIGGTSWFTYYNFPGQINDLRFYSRALSAAEVQALYNAEK